jgi:hypothetical protein
MLLVKSFGMSGITTALTETLKIILLNVTGNPNKTIIISSIFSYCIAYIAQRYVFAGGKFFGLSFLKYFAVSAITIQLYSLILKKLLDVSIVKKTLDRPGISETRKKVYQYILINITILSVFICVDFPLRKYFIFNKRKHIDYIISYILYFVALVMYVFSYIYK